MKKYITVGALSITIDKLNRIESDPENKLITIYHEGYCPFVHRCASMEETEKLYKEIVRKLKRIEKIERFMKMFNKARIHGSN